MDLGKKWGEVVGVAKTGSEENATEEERKNWDKGRDGVKKKESISNKVQKRTTPPIGDHKYSEYVMGSTKGSAGAPFSKWGPLLNLNSKKEDIRRLSLCMEAKSVQVEMYWNGDETTGDN